MMDKLSLGDIVFLQPLGNFTVRSKPDYLLEAKITKIAKKYLYLCPVDCSSSTNYARVERETLMKYDLDNNGGWVLWRSRKDFEDHQAAERALACISDLCRCIQNQFSSLDNRSSTQPTIEQIKSICMEMTNLLTVIEVDREMPGAENKEEIAAAARSAVQAYVAGERKPMGFHQTYQFIRDTINEYAK